MNFSLNPSLDHALSEKNLKELISPEKPAFSFASHISRLEKMFEAYKSAASPPWFATRLHILPETDYQSELWLPLSSIKPVFERFFIEALNYTPILSSTPFALHRSWAGIVADMPEFFNTASPSLLLKALLENYELRKRFIFHSFMPKRFYGKKCERYPAQLGFIKNILPKFKGNFRFLDAAFGDGYACYKMADMLLENGYAPGSFHVEGWTIEPLEVWCSAHARFPHLPGREAELRQMSLKLHIEKAEKSVQFKVNNLLGGGNGYNPTQNISRNEIRPTETDYLYSDSESANVIEGFDIILCNGLLGGPIIHKSEQTDQIVSKLAGLLKTGGFLMASDNFHSGWSKKCPQAMLRALFEKNSLSCVDAGEGICGEKKLLEERTNSEPYKQPTP